MAEIFGAVGTAISMVDLILKRIKTVSRFKKDAESAAADILRLCQEMDRRKEQLSDLYGELTNLDLRGSNVALRCLEACRHEIRELQSALTLFECRLDDGRTWWTVFTTKLEFAWKKEDVKELHRNIQSANETLADGLRACQLYIARASFGELRGIRTHDLPTISSAIRDMRASDLPGLARSIRASNKSDAANILRTLVDEARNTKETVIESGWTTTSAIGKLEANISQNVTTQRAEIEATLMPPMEQHMEIAKAHLQEFRSFRSQFGAKTARPQPRPATVPDTASETESSSSETVNPQDHMKTKQMVPARWEGQLLLGFGSLNLRQEVKQRVLIRVRKYIGETDTTIDTETTWILGFIPNSWLFGNTLTGCNWKFSFKSSRRLGYGHPALYAAQDGDVDQLITFFDKGLVSINDVREEDGDSLLHIAAMYYRYEFCEWLVSNGIDAQIANDNHETAVFSLAQTAARDLDDPEDPALYRRSRNATDSATLPKGYDPMLSLLIERCNLDPNDANRDGKSTLEITHFKENQKNRFSRLLAHSMVLCTEPEGYRIQQLFHSIAADSQPPPSTLMRLKHLLDEYERLGLPFDSTQATKWHHTPDFLWTLVARVENKKEDEISHHPYRENSNEFTYDWVEDQICQLIQSGVDVHSTRGGQTLLDFLAAGLLIHRDVRIEVRVAKWLSAMHKARGMGFLADYLEQELDSHPGGELVENDSHYYLEYPAFMVAYDDKSDEISIHRGQVVVNASEEDGPNVMPGGWQSDPETDFCNQHGLRLRFRYSEDGSPDTEIAEDDWLSGRHADPALAGEVDEDAIDWELEDGREGQFYRLWTISTAGFDHGDYSFDTSSEFRRDYDMNQLWVEYPKGWIQIGPAHGTRDSDTFFTNRPLSGSDTDTEMEDGD